MLLALDAFNASSLRSPLEDVNTVYMHAHRNPGSHSRYGDCVVTQTALYPNEFWN
jgi:hypothetical protein